MLSSTLRLGLRATRRGALPLRACSAGIVNRGMSSDDTTNPKRIALILAGCGVQDGSEIQESTAIIFHVDRLGGSIRAFAPDSPQQNVIDHTTGNESEGETRSMLVESARIVRGDVEALSTLNVDDYDALMIPGGFGVAKNLCTFAIDGAEMTVDKEVERVVRDFHNARKPMGLTCIAPVLLAKILPGVKITLGKSGDDWPNSGAIDAARSMSYSDAIDNSRMMGAMRVIECGEGETLVDETYKVVTGPAYMHDSTPYKVYQNVGKVVEDTFAFLE